MFLIDYTGCVGSWNLPFVERFDSYWQPNHPVKLTEIGEFSEDELITWLDYEAEELPTHLTDDVEQTTRVILENSDNGIPEPTMVEICRISNCNWYEHEEKWLKY